MATDIRSLRRRRRDVGRFRSTIDGAPQTPIGARARQGTVEDGDWGNEKWR
jgi:hypothetical protein